MVDAALGIRTTSALLIRTTSAFTPRTTSSLAIPDDPLYLSANLAQRSLHHRVDFALGR